MPTRPLTISGKAAAILIGTPGAAWAALGRLRCRHAFRYPPLEPSLDLSPGPKGPTIRNLASAEGQDEEFDRDERSRRPFHTFDAPERRLEPGHVEIGARHGATITVEMTELSGVAFRGDAAHDIVRALLAGVLVGAAPGAAEVLMTVELADQLLPGLRPSPVLRRATSDADLARAVHAEMIGRARRLDAAGALDSPASARLTHETLYPLWWSSFPACPTSS